MPIKAVTKQETFGSPFYMIGYVKNKEGNLVAHEMGLAIDHDNGKLTNERLLAMSDSQLRELAYSPKGVWAETYKYPIVSWGGSKREDISAGGYYQGPHRALTILNYRKALEDAAQGRFDEERESAQLALEQHGELADLIVNPDTEKKLSDVRAKWLEARAKLTGRAISREVKTEEKWCAKHEQDMYVCGEKCLFEQPLEV